LRLAIAAPRSSTRARERWEYKHLFMLGRWMRWRRAAAPLPTLPIFDIEDIPLILISYL
jgi:hypothetical protein